MELAAHDLIRFSSADNFLNNQPVPEWALAAIKETPYAVVRRGESGENEIPVGIRGRSRSERFGTWIKNSHILEVIRPAALTNVLNWKTQYNGRFPKTIESLIAISPILNESGLEWGPAGSTGFEMATGRKTIKDSSDLDLVLYLPDLLATYQAKTLLYLLESKSSVRLDVQMQTPAGGVSLKEYTQASRVLVKTLSGPVLQKGYSLWDKKKKDQKTSYV